MDLSKVLSLISPTITVVAYVVYLRTLKKPNAVSWGIWATICLVSTWIYVVMASDWWISLLILVNSFFCMGTFVFLLVKRKFAKVDVEDEIALVLGIIAATIWFVYRLAAQANLIIQVAIVIGFIPMWRGQWRRRVEERSLPWVIWVVAYIISIAVVLLRWNNHWVALVYPVNCLICHATVALLAARRQPVVLPLTMTV